MTLTLPTFLARTDLSRSLLLGFYGGGNYGDELLLEVLTGLLQQHQAHDISVAFQRPEQYQRFHHDVGYQRLDMHRRSAMLRAVLRHRQLLVGGGGLWGMDANLNVLLMSLLLFAARWLLGKKVYLVAVGYYNSAPAIGQLAAWLAAKAANHIIARDRESYDNFRRWQRHTSQDVDIAWYIRDLDLEPYQADLAALESKVPIHSKTIFMTLRRFRGNGSNHLAAVIAQTLQRNRDKQIIIALLEPRHVDPAGYSLLQSWRQQFSNVSVLDFAFNPLALYLFFARHHNDLVFIGPQFHAILSAHLTGVPYLPLAYDNKVTGLLHTIAPELPPISLPAVEHGHLQQFIDQAYGLAN